MNSALALLVAAPIVGSFLGVVIQRLPDGGQIVAGRSKCPHCGVALAARDLVPVASWLAARGRCRYCAAWLGWFYPGVELASLAIALISLAVDHGVMAWVDWAFGCWLLTLGWIDLRRWILPDALTLPLIFAGMAVTWEFSHGDWHDRSAGVVCGFLFLWGVAACYRYWRGRDGLGLGDAKLFAACGAWVGLSGLPSVLLAAAVAALLTAGAMRLAGKEIGRHSALQFGPFLAAGGWAVWLFGPLAFSGG